MPVQNEDEVKDTNKQQNNQQANEKADQFETVANTPDESLTGPRIVGKWNLDVSYKKKEERKEEKEEKDEKTAKEKNEQTQGTDSTSKVYERLGFDKNSSLDKAFEEIRQSFKEDDALFSDSANVSTPLESSKDVLQQQIDDKLGKLKTDIQKPFEKIMQDGLNKLKQKFGSTANDDDEKTDDKQQDENAKEIGGSTDNSLPKEPASEGQGLEKFDSAVSEVADQVKEAVKEAIKEVVKAALDAIVPGLGQAAGNMVADKIADAAVEQIKDKANELKQNLTETAEKTTATTAPTPAPSRAR